MWANALEKKQKHSLIYPKERYSSISPSLTKAQRTHSYPGPFWALLLAWSHSGQGCRSGSRRPSGSSARRSDNASAGPSQLPSASGWPWPDRHHSMYWCCRQGSGTLRERPKKSKITKAGISNLLLLQLYISIKLWNAESTTSKTFSPINAT